MAETLEKHMTPCPHSVGAEQPLRRAMESMRHYKVRHMPVLHGGELVGMLSDRDIVLLENLADALHDDLKVEEVMSTEPYAVPKDTSLSEVLEEMAARNVGSAVAMDGNSIAGIFTSTDAVIMLAKRI